MDRLRQLLVYVNSQMALLTVSQRLAIGLCAALIAGSLLWLLQWSTQPDLTPLLSKDFSYAELEAAETSLKANKIPYEIHGTRIFVSPAERHNALRVAHSAGALPEGSLFDMEAMITSILFAVRAGMMPSQAASTISHFSFIPAQSASTGSISQLTHLPPASFAVKGG